MKYRPIVYILLLWLYNQICKNLRLCLQQMECLDGLPPLLKRD